MNSAAEYSATLCPARSEMPHLLRRDFAGAILSDCRVNRDTSFGWEGMTNNSYAKPRDRQQPEQCPRWQAAPPASNGNYAAHQTALDTFALSRASLRVRRVSFHAMMATMRTPMAKPQKEQFPISISHRKAPVHVYPRPRFLRRVSVPSVFVFCRHAHRTGWRTPLTSSSALSRSPSQAVPSGNTN
jgi:hypothetical protein